MTLAIACQHCPVMNSHPVLLAFPNVVHAKKLALSASTSVSVFTGEIALISQVLFLE